MQNPAGSLLFILLILATGCGCATEQPATQEPGPVASPPALLTATTPLPEAGDPEPVGIAGLALRAEDLPGDYILRDRSVMTVPEVTQLSRDLGWMQGYFVTFDRVGRIRDDKTRIRQSINIFPAGSLIRVYNLEKIAQEGGASMMSSPDEIPFPAMGERSIAYRFTNTPEEGQVTYVVLFIKKNAFERITMAGTSTDYETFRDIVQKAAAKIA